MHKKSKDKFVRELKAITKRNNGKDFFWLKKRLTDYVRSRKGYYYMADMKPFLQETELWYHRRLCSNIWKSWKRVRIRFKNLIRCDISRWWAWQWANTRKGYWRIADSPILHRAISNEHLHYRYIPPSLESTAGCIVIKEPPYAEHHVRWCERSENESRKKLLRFPPYSIIRTY